MTPEPIDLHHLGRERVIASYLLDTDDGPALFDCGPTSTVETLKAGLAERGLQLTDVRHLLLSHIHLDHAGAAGVLVREHPALQVHDVGKSGAGLDCFPTPGHASHHVSYLDRDGTLYAGDAAGVRIQPGRYVMPPTPPPEFDLETWQRTIDEIERRGPERLALIHFGVADDPQRHLADLRLELY